MSFANWAECEDAGWTATPAVDRWIVNHDGDNVTFQVQVKADAVAVINELTAPKPLPAPKPELDSELSTLTLH